MNDLNRGAGPVGATAGLGWRAPSVPFALAAVATGVAAGLGGMVLALLLHLIQHVAYGYSLDAVISPETFLQGVTAASPLRRGLVLTLCGVVAGLGWWAVYRFGRPLVSIKSAVGSRALGPSMPFGATVAHALLQIVTVALGSPLGREVAPREIGALMAGWFARRAGFSAEEIRILVACGAGAGLAAVYNVPVSGGLFVLEVLLGTFAPAALIPAVATSAIAATIAWIGLGNVAQYDVPVMAVSPSLLAASLVTGPVCGIAAFMFRSVARRASAKSAKGWRRIVWCLAVFFILGLLAGPFPQLPGNGKGPAQLAFAGDIGLTLALGVLLLKIAATTISLRAGAAGGLLTPSMTIGALIASILGNGWNNVFPIVPLGAFAIVGGAAFLATSLDMPVTAIMLVIEFTHVSHDFWAPVVFAVIGSVVSAKLWAALASRVAPKQAVMAPAAGVGRG